VIKEPENSGKEYTVRNIPFAWSASDPDNCAHISGYILHISTSDGDSFDNGIMRTQPA
jgi:hypothetical protein